MRYDRGNCPPPTVSFSLVTGLRLQEETPKALLSIAVLGLR